MPPEVNEDFVAWLKSRPDELAKFAEIMVEWVEHGGEPPPKPPPSSAGGPRKWNVGEKHELSTRAFSITNDELDSIVKAQADAAVIEKFVIALRAFVSGVVFKGVSL